MNVRLRQLLRDATDPSYVAMRLRRPLRKAWRKLRKTDEQVVALDAATEPARGRVLLSYILEPFLLPRGDDGRPKMPYSHTHFWETWTIAETWRRHGFAVDVVSWQNRRWMPEADYDAVIDVRCNLDRWAPVLPESTLQIFHADTAHHAFHNAAQTRRVEDLNRRRDAAVRPHKLVEPNRGAEQADVLTVLGNEFTQETYAGFGKPIFHVPVSVPRTYEWPEGKDFHAARRSFLWFGSGGLVHKGLDLVLEAFAGLPDLHLTVCGPVRGEPDFEREFWNELYRTPNIHTHGWIDVASDDFLELARRTAGLVYPSCSEGGGSSVYTCMHAGLVPLIQREVSVDLDPSYAVELRDVSVDGLRRAISGFAARPAEELESLARGAWEYARAHHTKETFRRRYDEVVQNLVEEHLRAPSSGRASGRAPGTAPDSTTRTAQEAR